ncbi:MAG: hypothetical protein ABII68_07535 [Pseudomonadota bacterium]
MLIHDDTYTWKGWGGTLSLGSGKCRLRIYDLDKDGKKRLAHLKSIIVVVSDVPGSKASVKSCTSHIATRVTQEFNIDPNRMLWIEHYPEDTYGPQGSKVLPERLEAVEFKWHGENAIDPMWKDLISPMLDIVKDLIK